MRPVFHILFIFILIALHLSYVYFIIRPKKKKEEDHYVYILFGMAVTIGIWVYAEHMFFNVWGIVSSRLTFAIFFLSTLVIVSRIIAIPALTRKNIRDFIRRNYKSPKSD